MDPKSGCLQGAMLQNNAHHAWQRLEERVWMLCIGSIVREVRKRWKEVVGKTL